MIYTIRINDEEMYGKFREKQYARTALKEAGYTQFGGDPDAWDIDINRVNYLAIVTPFREPRRITQMPSK